ncbi:MAG: NAD(P)-binding protein [Candidatus Lokiarchaeota archaeon]|nr:NAD(P)-binding protein [Candidatus Lokiarchaeota archaeon]
MKALKEDEYGVIVIGTGFGGASCATLLANKGIKTLLIDKNKFFGGRAFTTEVHSHKVDFFSHLLCMGGEGQIGAVLKEINAFDRIKFLQTKVGSLFIYDEKPVELKTSMNIGTILRLIEWMDVKEKEELQHVMDAFKFLMNMQEHNIDRIYNLTVEEWLERQFPHVPVTFKDFLTLWCGMMFVNPAKYSSAGEYARYFTRILDAKAAGYCSGGIGHIPEIMAERIEENGSFVKMGDKVEKILIDDGRAVGVQTASGNIYKADAIVSNVGIQPTVLKLVGEEHFSKDYLAYVKELIPSFSGVRIRYFLNEKVLDEKYGSILVYGANHNVRFDWNTIGKKTFEELMEPINLPVFTSVPSNFDPSLSPPGEQAILATAIAPPNPSRKQWDILFDKIEDNLFKSFPTISQHIEHVDKADPKAISEVSGRGIVSEILPGVGGEAVGLAQVPEQVGYNKPKPQSPIPGLFYVGCDANVYPGGGGVGLEQATNSGRNTARIVFSYLFGKKLRTI